ncbi:hypothetical protein F5Y11DRAFT_352615 [Daldinia sp. FL1419]|nr:hypothetical protein F5Y11DRAFT_352615 [Daldinia sp. FL1419]
MFHTSTTPSEDDLEAGHQPERCDSSADTIAVVDHGLGQGDFQGNEELVKYAANFNLEGLSLPPLPPPRGPNPPPEDQGDSGVSKWPDWWVVLVVFSICITAICVTLLFAIRPEEAESQP